MSFRGSGPYQPGGSPQYVTVEDLERLRMEVHEALVSIRTNASFASRRVGTLELDRDRLYREVGQLEGHRRRQSDRIYLLEDRTRPLREKLKDWIREKVFNLKLAWQRLTAKKEPPAAQLPKAQVQVDCPRCQGACFLSLGSLDGAQDSLPCPECANTGFIWVEE